jgi:acyl carrier protein
MSGAPDQAFGMRSPRVQRSSAVSDDERVISRIIDVIRTLEGMTPEVLAKVTPQTNIVRDLNLDSIAVMDFILELEGKFNTIISLDTVAGIETIADLARVLKPQSAQVAQ